MIDPRIPLTTCVTSVTNLTPLILNCVIRARPARLAPSARDAYLDQAIRHAEQLVEDLKLQKLRLQSRESDVA